MKRRVSLNDSSAHIIIPHSRGTVKASTANGMSKQAHSQHTDGTNPKKKTRRQS
jgi:hypothetical protein